MLFRSATVSAVTIEYVFKLNDGQTFNFEVDTERTYQARFDKVEHPL